jgi:hypothetical protein
VKKPAGYYESWWRAAFSIPGFELSLRELFDYLDKAIRSSPVTYFSIPASLA